MAHVQQTGLYTANTAVAQQRAPVAQRAAAGAPGLATVSTRPPHRAGATGAPPQTAVIAGQAPAPGAPPQYITGPPPPPQAIVNIAAAPPGTAYTVPPPQGAVAYPTSMPQVNIELD